MTAAPLPKLLVVEDELPLGRSLAELLEQSGYPVTLAGSVDEALLSLRSDTFALALVDYQLPGKSGLELLAQLDARCPETRCVLITGHGSTRTAVAALKRGADEYLEKPVPPRRLLSVVQGLLADAPPFVWNGLLDEEARPGVRYGEVLSRAPALHQLFDRLRRLEGASGPVVLIGELGVGRASLLQALHAASAPRGALTVVEPGRVQQLCEGPVDGAATDGEAKAGRAEHGTAAARAHGHAAADDGTAAARARGHAAADDGTAAALLVREVDQLSEAEARTLLGHLDRRPEARPLRLLSTARQAPMELVSAGGARGELALRLGSTVLEVPPLRRRPEDIPLLAAQLLVDCSARLGRALIALPARTQQLLTDYDWPGNVRELRNVIEQGVLLSRESALDPEALPQLLHRRPSTGTWLQFSIGTALDQIERQVIVRTLEAHGGNKTLAAEVLGISRRSIYNKLAAYGLPTDE